MNHLRLSFLGAFQVTLGDKPLTKFRSAKAQGLLIYLALTAQQAHGRDLLAALFWPEEPEKRAKQNLRQSLYLLRKLLGDTKSQKRLALSLSKRPFLLISRTTVQFNPVSEHSLDVADFLTALEEGELETAVSFYHGDLLPGFSCDSLPFDDWLRQEREQRHRQALDALNKLTSHSLTRADFHTAERFARQQLRLEPWREEAHRQLIQALALQGERSAALAQVETCRMVLAEELGIDPASETENLAQRIREVQLAQPAQQEAGGNLGRRLTIPFVGRKSEYATLVKAYRQAASGGMQVVTLSGKSGIGKTRLTQHFLTWAATQGADVLNGRSFETSAGLSYQPLTHLLRQRLERENAPEDLLSDLWLSQLTRLLPELRDRYPDLPQPTQEENTARQHLFEAVTRLLLALAARQPLILFIDDWHWADTASLDLLHYAAVRWAEARAPILLLLTLRQEAVNESPDLQNWLKRFHHGVVTQPLHLSELSQPETEHLIQRLLDPENGDGETKLTQFSDWLFAETDGQPLFLTETLKALVQDGLVKPDKTPSRSAGSTSLSNSGQAVWHIDWAKFNQQMQGSSGRVLPQVQQIIRGWLDRITAPAGKLLTAAAVLANEITFDHLCYVAELEQFEALTALDELLGKQLLLELGEPSPAATHEPMYSFSHQKVSAMVYAEAGAARRRILHQRAFEAYQTGAAAADCAHHALNAGLLAEAIHHSLIAGNEAMALFAFRVAIAHFETARQLSEQKGWPESISGADRQALYVGLGRAYELTDAWLKAQETYEAMIAAAQTMGAAAMECLGLNRLAAICLFHRPGDQQKAVALLKQAQMVAEQSGDRRGMAETEWTLSLAARAEDTQLALYHGEQAMEIARELGHRQLLARCLSLLAYNNLPIRQWETAEAYAEESRQLYTAVGNLVLAADSQRIVGYCQMALGRPHESHATLQDTLHFSQQIENLWGEADCGFKLAVTHLELGFYDQAIKVARQAVEQARRVDHPPLILWASLAYGTVQRTLMRLDAARETQLAVLAESTEMGFHIFSDFKIFSEWALAELCAGHALAGNWDQARDYAKQTLQIRGEALLPFTFTSWYETEALLRGGEGDLARAEVERLAGIVGNNRRYRLPLLRSQAVLAQWDGDVAQAIAYLQSALALAREIGLPGEAWPILGELGRLYVEQGEQVKARQVYKDAAVIIHRLAETIDDDNLRVGFLTAVSVQSILEINGVA